MSDHSQHHTEESPTHKGDEASKHDVGKRIGEFLILLLYLVIDAFEIWPHSHLIATASIPVGVLALLLLDGGSSKARVAVVTGAVAFLCAGLYIFAPPAEPTIGWLQSANEPTPPNGCDPFPKRPLLIAGSNGFPLDTKSKSATLRIGECSISIIKGPNGVAVTADIYSPEGDLIGRIVNNEYRLFTDKRLNVERTGDLSALIAHDDQKRELLNIRYLNPDAIRLRGILSCPRPTLQTVLITDSAIFSGSASTVHSCFPGDMLSVGSGFSVKIGP